MPSWYLLHETRFGVDNRIGTTMGVPPFLQFYSLCLIEFIGAVLSRLKAGQQQHLVLMYPSLHDSAIYDAALTSSTGTSHFYYWPCSKVAVF